MAHIVESPLEAQAEVERANSQFNQSYFPVDQYNGHHAHHKLNSSMSPVGETIRSSAVVNEHHTAPTNLSSFQTPERPISTNNSANFDSFPILQHGEADRSNIGETSSGHLSPLGLPETFSFENESGTSTPDPYEHHNAPLRRSSPGSTPYDNTYLQAQLNHVNVYLSKYTSNSSCSPPRSAPHAYAEVGDGILDMRLGPTSHSSTYINTPWYPPPEAARNLDQDRTSSGHMPNSSTSVMPPPRGFAHRYSPAHAEELYPKGGHIEASSGGLGFTSALALHLSQKQGITRGRSPFHSSSDVELRSHSSHTIQASAASPSSSVAYTRDISSALYGSNSSFQSRTIGDVPLVHTNTEYADTIRGVTTASSSPSSLTWSSDGSTILSPLHLATDSGLRTPTDSEATGRMLYTNDTAQGSHQGSHQTDTRILAASSRYPGSPISGSGSSEGAERREKIDETQVPNGLAGAHSGLRDHSVNRTKSPYPYAFPSTFSVHTDAGNPAFIPDLHSIGTLVVNTDPNSTLAREISPDVYVAVDPFRTPNPHHGAIEYHDLPRPNQSSPPKKSVHPLVISFINLVCDLIRQLYLYSLFCLPRLYFSRVTRIFEEAELSMREIRHAARQSKWRDDLVTSSVFQRLRESWQEFVNCLLKEWKILNIVSALLLAVILATLQIDSAALDPICRLTALLSLICAFMSLLFGCAYSIKFGTMKKVYQAAVWAEEGRRRDASIFWNMWILLAMPAVWLSWSIVLYTGWIIAFTWRTGWLDNGVASSTIIQSEFAYPSRIAITVVMSIGVLHLILILHTLSYYGESAWKDMLRKWSAEARTPTVSVLHLDSIQDPTSLPNSPHLRRGESGPQNTTHRRNSRPLVEPERAAPEGDRSPVHVQSDIYPTSASPRSVQSSDRHEPRQARAQVVEARVEAGASGSSQQYIFRRVMNGSEPTNEDMLIPRPTTQSQSAASSANGGPSPQVPKLNRELEEIPNATTTAIELQRSTTFVHAHLPSFQAAELDAFKSPKPMPLSRPSPVVTPNEEAHVHPRVDTIYAPEDSSGPWETPCNLDERESPTLDPVSLSLLIPKAEHLVASSSPLSHNLGNPHVYRGLVGHTYRSPYVLSEVPKSIPGIWTSVDSMRPSTGTLHSTASNTHVDRRRVARHGEAGPWDTMVPAAAPLNRDESSGFIPVTATNKQSRGQNLAPPPLPPHPPGGSRRLGMPRTKLKPIGPYRQPGQSALKNVQWSTMLEHHIPQRPAYLGDPSVWS